jgi:hypothetical protein
LSLPLHFTLLWLSELFDDYKLRCQCIYFCFYFCCGWFTPPYKSQQTRGPLHYGDDTLGKYKSYLILDFNLFISNFFEVLNRLTNKKLLPVLLSFFRVDEDLFLNFVSFHFDWWVAMLSKTCKYIFLIQTNSTKCVNLCYVN